MTEEEKIQKAKAFLDSYTLYKSWLNANRYERRYFGAAPDGDDAFLQAKMFLVRSLILSLPNLPEKLFLNCHYLRGHTVEKCAELMDISPRSAYRLKKKALLLVSRALEEKAAQTEPSSF